MEVAASETEDVEPIFEHPSFLHSSLGSQGIMEIALE